MARPNPILIDIPDQLATERLLLRVPQAGDGTVVYAGIQESLPQLRRWMPWAQGKQTATHIEVISRQTAAAFIRRESLTYRIFRQHDGQFIGTCSVFNFVWHVPSCEIGYWQRTTMQGNGYITEAVNYLTGFAFDTLRVQRIEIRCEGSNRRSAAVAKRAGFSLEGRLRHHRRNPLGELADTLVYARIASGRHSE